jgi:hypothetical protein
METIKSEVEQRKRDLTCFLKYAEEQNGDKTKKLSVSLTEDERGTAHVHL